MPSNLNDAASVPAALSAFLRGVERRGALFAELQCGDREAGDSALAAAMRAFRNRAGTLPMAEWPRRFWTLLVATPQLRQSAASARWPAGVEALAGLQSAAPAGAAAAPGGEPAGGRGRGGAGHRPGSPRAGPGFGLPARCRRTTRRAGLARAGRSDPIAAARLAAATAGASGAPAGSGHPGHEDRAPCRRQLFRIAGRGAVEAPALALGRAGTGAVCGRAGGDLVVAAMAGLARRRRQPRWRRPASAGPSGNRESKRSPEQPPAARFDATTALLTHPDFELLLEPQDEAIARDADFLAWYAAGANAPSDAPEEESRSGSGVDSHGNGDYRCAVLIGRSRMD